MPLCRRSARPAASDAFFEIVTFAVEFNDELAGVRDEIRDVVAHGALPAKAQPREAICLQVAPQQGFGARHRAAQLLGAGSLNFAYLSMRHTPLPTLPRKGGGSPASVLT